ncbi:MAG: hypothetical protein F8N37_12005 [Telmatospirillum sp.]|nr:hypothetical protein [Telmatospirillum sp.]
MEKSEKFNMRVSRKFTEMIDEWRRHQPDIPARAEAIRRLSTKGLAFGAIREVALVLISVIEETQKKGGLPPELAKALDFSQKSFANADAWAHGAPEPFPMVRELTKEEELLIRESASGSKKNPG